MSTRDDAFCNVDVEVAASRLAALLVEEVPSQVVAVVADAVALVVDVSPETIEVTVIPQLAPRDAELIDAARHASQEAARASELASQLSRQAVAQLRSEGMTVRDVGGLLGVSPQRVSQLVES